MNSPSLFHDLWFTITRLMTWRDIVEILFFSTAIYYVSVWLKHDRHKNLLGYFYAYCLIGIGAYALNLSGIVYILGCTTPIMIMLFILMHQQTLQKNFIALRTITAATPKHAPEWLDVVIRSYLIAINNNKSIICIIEHTDDIAEHLHAPITLQAPVKEDLLAILIESPSFQQEQMIWINSQGIVRGINASWKQPLDEQWASHDLHALESWKQDALFFTSKYDAVVFSITPQSRTFTVIVHGKVFDHIPASNILAFIKKYIHTPQHSDKQGELAYVSQIKKHSVRQHNS